METVGGTYILMIVKCPFTTVKSFARCLWTETDTNIFYRNKRNQEKYKVTKSSCYSGNRRQEEVMKRSHEQKYAEDGMQIAKARVGKLYRIIDLCIREYNWQKSEVRLMIPIHKSTMTTSFDVVSNECKKTHVNKWPKN